MRIDFDKIEGTEVPHMKGGEGSVLIQVADDGAVRIMRATVHPHSSFGLHRHEGTCEVVYVISGTGAVADGDEDYPLAPGSVTYCPEGHVHAIRNDGDGELVLFAVVPKVPVEG